MGTYGFKSAQRMWRVVFFERRGPRVHVDRSGPWLPDRHLAMNWAQWFASRGYHVALQDSEGLMERLCAGLPR